MYFLCIYVCIHSIIYLSLFFSSFFILLSFFSSYTPILFQLASHFCVYLFLLFLCISSLPPFGTYIDSDTRFWQFWTSFSSTFWHLLCPRTSLFHSLRVPVLHQFWHPFRTPPGPVQPSKCLSFSSFVFQAYSLSSPDPNLHPVVATIEFYRHRVWWRGAENLSGTVSVPKRFSVYVLCILAYLLFTSCQILVWISQFWCFWTFVSSSHFWRFFVKFHLHPWSSFLRIDGSHQGTTARCQSWVLIVILMKFHDFGPSFVNFVVLASWLTIEDSCHFLFQLLHFRDFIVILSDLQLFIDFVTFLVSSHLYLGISCVCPFPSFDQILTFGPSILMIFTILGPYLDTWFRFGVMTHHWRFLSLSCSGFINSCVLSVHSSVWSFSRNCHFWTPLTGCPQWICFTPFPNLWQLSSISTPNFANFVTFGHYFHRFLVFCDIPVLCLVFTLSPWLFGSHLLLHFVTFHQFSSNLSLFGHPNFMFSRLNFVIFSCLLLFHVWHLLLLCPWQFGSRLFCMFQLHQFSRFRCPILVSFWRPDFHVSTSIIFMFLDDVLWHLAAWFAHLCTCDPPVTCRRCLSFLMSDFHVLTSQICRFLVIILSNSGVWLLICVWHLSHLLLGNSGFSNFDISQVWQFYRFIFNFGTSDLHVMILMFIFVIFTFISCPCVLHVVICLCWCLNPLWNLTPILSLLVINFVDFGPNFDISGHPVFMLCTFVYFHVLHLCPGLLGLLDVWLLSKTRFICHLFCHFQDPILSSNFHVIFVFQTSTFDIPFRHRLDLHGHGTWPDLDLTSTFDTQNLHFDNFAIFKTPTWIPISHIRFWHPISTFGPILDTSLTTPDPDLTLDNTIFLLVAFRPFKTFQNPILAFRRFCHFLVPTFSLFDDFWHPVPAFSLQNDFWHFDPFLEVRFTILNCPIFGKWPLFLTFDEFWSWTLALRNTHQFWTSDWHDPWPHFGLLKSDFWQLLNSSQPYMWIFYMLRFNLLLEPSPVLIKLMTFDPFLTSSSRVFLPKLNFHLLISWILSILDLWIFIFFINYFVKFWSTFCITSPNEFGLVPCHDFCSRNFELDFGSISVIEVA